MSRRLVLVLAVVAALAGCGSVMRVAYNNGDFALRLMANEYFDPEGEQQDVLKAQLARFHEWHRREELPAYGRIFQGAADRVARGLKPEDVSWAIAAVRERYRLVVAQAAEDGAPLVATFKPDNYAALERKFDEVNAKFTKDYLSGDQAKRDKARAKWFEERFEYFIGDLTDAQVALIQRFVQTQPRMNEVRLADRKRRQQAFVALIRQYQSSPELGERMRGFFVHWERDRGPEHARLAREWENRLVQLVVDIDGTLTPEQRTKLVGRFETLAEDCRVLARQGRPGGEARAAVESAH
ncbi:MAG: DUF6279 family lipoprotein [Burkholderiales bacterium]